MWCYLLARAPAIKFLSERVRQASRDLLTLVEAAGVWAQARGCLASAQRLRVGIGSLSVAWWHLGVLGLKVAAVPCLPSSPAWL